MARLRLFPLNSVLFPGATLQLHVFEPRYRRMLAECLEANEPFGVCLIRDGDEAGDPDVTPFEVGCTAAIDDVTRLPQGRFYVSTHGARRFRVTGILERDPFLVCEVEYLDEDPADDEAVVRLANDVGAQFREYVRLLVDVAGVAGDGDVPDDPLAASYRIGDGLQVAGALKQRLLEARSTRQRLTTEAQFLRRLLPQLRALRDGRARAAATAVPREARGTGGETRADQERFFGKYFSLN